LETDDGADTRLEAIMRIARRSILQGAVAAAALPIVSPIAKAESYPARPVHIVIGFPAGSPADIVARPAAQLLSEHLGQQFIIDNRPGAAGNIGAEIVVKAANSSSTA
jgi:tripartite-type tricarboxylate transporter receptor subunit TctC